MQKIEIGMEAHISKTITEADIILYSGISLDINPIHINSEYSKKSIFKKRVAHGMLSAGLISAVLGTKLPGEGSIYLEQSLKFLKPVYIGDTITAIAEVKKINDKKVTLYTYCLNQSSEKVIEGEAIILYEGRN